MDYENPNVSGGIWQPIDPNKLESSIDVVPSRSVTLSVCSQPKPSFIASRIAGIKARIPRPPNAFMLFANENRRRVAKQFPQESNKEISCRLGMQWKCLPMEQKDKYFTLAKQADAEHKKKYPDYVYNPKEARIRKAIRERERLIAGGSGICDRGPPTVLSPALSRNGRRSPHWASAQHPHQMGQPPSSALGSPFGHCAPPLPLPAHQQSRMHSVGMGMEHGGGDYVFGGVPPPYQQPAYIHLPPNDWIANSYLQNNASLHQQFWNQYHHTERLKPPHPKSIGRNYIIPPDDHQYLQVEQLPNNPMLSHHNSLEVPKDMTLPNTSTAPNSNSCLTSDYIGCSPLTPCSNQSEVNTPTNVIDVAATCDDHYAEFSTVPTSSQSQTDMLERPVDLVSSNPRDMQNLNHQINEHQPIETNEFLVYEKQTRNFEEPAMRNESFKNMNVSVKSEETFAPFKIVKNIEDIFVNGEILESYSISEVSYVDEVPLDFSSQHQYQMIELDDQNCVNVNISELKNESSNDENIILDLSKSADNLEEKDNQDKTKFSEISTKICDVLAKLF